MLNATNAMRPRLAGASVPTPVTAPSTLPTLLQTGAAAAPDAACLLSATGAGLTWRQLLDQLDRTRAALRAFDIGPEDRVAVVMANGPVLGAAFLALASAAACAPLNPSYSAEEFAFYLGDLKAKALVVADKPAAAALAAAERLGIRVIEVEADPASPGLFAFGAMSGASDPGGLPRPDSVALLLHTSGTTSRPKLVPLRHSNLVASALNMVRTLELTTADRCLDLMPLFHIHGLIGGLLAPLAAGGSTTCPPAFRPNAFFPWLEATAPTWYTAVPTMHRIIAAEAANRDLRNCGLRFLRSSSAPLPMSLFEELEGMFGVPVVEAYSMTEAAHQMTCNPLAPGRQKPGTVGVPAGPEVGLLHESGRILPADAVGEIGEVVIRGPSVMDGYEANPQANAEAFVEGWFRTGDQGRFDEDGYLVLTGRIKEQINRGGEKISPLEIDQAMLRHPDVAEAVAFGFPHPTLGEEVAAAAVLRPDARTTPADLHTFLREKLAPFKLPKRIITLDQIPKGPTGKIQRRLLAKQLMDQPGPAEVAEAGEVAEAAEGPEADLLALWRTVLERPDLGLDEDFFESGGDSLRALQILFEIELLTGRDLPESILLDHPTVRDLARALSTGEHSQADRIVRLQTDGTRAPLFFFTGDQNGGYYTRRLARLLGPDQPFVAVAPHDPATAPPTIESMAADGLPLLLELHPHGSFRLAGYCNGGMIALETARLLLEAGRTVEFVALIDTPPLNFRPAARAVFRLLSTESSARPARAADPWYAKATDVAWRQLNNVLYVGYGYAGYVAKGVMHRLGLSSGDRTDLGRPALRDQIVARDLLQARVYNRVLRRYLPPRIDAPIVYYTAIYPRAAVRGLGPKAEIVPVPGGHWGCITSHAEALAADLRTRLAPPPPP